MHHTIPDGVYPTMITPYTEEGRIDYDALEKLVEWHIERGVAGLFAVCQSSEMFHLSLRERLELARMSIRFVHGRVPVPCVGACGRCSRRSDRRGQNDGRHGCRRVYLSDQ